MAELLIRVVSKAHGVVGAELAGDVIVVCPDGWGWTDAERTNQEWRIVRLPGVDPAALSDYTAVQVDLAGRVQFARQIGVDMGSVTGEWLAAAPQVSELSPEAVLDIIDATVAREEGQVL